MEYQVIGDDEVLIKDGERNVGVIRIQGINWVPRTHNGAEYPEHWVLRVPAVTVGAGDRFRVTGVSGAIAEAKKILG